jgi:hypothetical protein
MMERVKRIPPIAPIAFWLVISAISYVGQLFNVKSLPVCWVTESVSFAF